jgi:hypothetical protein
MPRCGRKVLSSRIATGRLQLGTTRDGDDDPATDGDEEAWARAVAAEGRRTWHPSGEWVKVGSRRLLRWALHRPCESVDRS